MFSHDIVNLRGRSHVGMLSHKEAIEYLKNARRNEVRHKHVIEGFEDIAKGGKNEIYISLVTFSIVSSKKN